MIDRHDPGMNAEAIETLFTELKEGLVPLMREIVGSPLKARDGLFHDFSGGAAAGLSARR